MDNFDYSKFIRDRITTLRMQKQISEYKMSRDLGHNKSYIANIMSKQTLPAMSEFIYICEYLQVTPRDFFDKEFDHPILLQKVTDKLKNLNDKQLQAILSIIDCMIPETDS